jgi:hypothetical protein
MALLPVIACTDPLKEPPGRILGTVTLSPEPIPGENWAYLEASSAIAQYAVTSDPITHEFAFENLKVENLSTMYFLQAYREGYISYGDSVLVQAGITISSFDIVLQRGSRQQAVFQDGVSPSPTYQGCLDTYIGYPDTTAAHGTEPIMIVEGGYPDNLSRGLIDFSFNWGDYFPVLDTFPRAVESATLRLYVDSVITTGSIDVAVFELDDDFLEGSANWIDNGFGSWSGGPGGSWSGLSSDTVSLGGVNLGWVEFSIDDIAESWLAESRSGPMIIKLLNEARPSSIYIRSANNDSTALHPELTLAINILQ